MNDQTPTTLGELLKAFGGSLKTGPFGTALKAAEYSKIGGVPVISVGEVGYGTLRVGKSTPRVGDDVLRRLPEYILRSGDIVFGRKGAVDRCGLVRENEGGYFLGSDGIRLRLGTGVDPEFLAYQFQSSRVRNWLVRNSFGTTMASLNQEVLGRVPVILPTLSEQRRAAEALNAADGLIATLDRLIAKKQAIKQGMMQQLLTGRTRLPGFTDEWRRSTVGAEFDVQLGKMLDAAKNTGVMKPYLGNRAVQWGRIKISAAGTVPMSPSDIHRYRLQEGDLLVCEGGEVGRAAIWRNELPECYFQKALHRLRAKNGYDVRVMRALLEFWSSVGSFADYVTQTSIAHLPREKLVEMPLPLPSIVEQRAMGDLVEDLDRQVACLERRIVKQRAIKQGMMQQLLTGRTRLPVEVAS